MAKAKPKASGNLFAITKWKIFLFIIIYTIFSVCLLSSNFSFPVWLLLLNAAFSIIVIFICYAVSSFLAGLLPKSKK